VTRPNLDKMSLKQLLDLEGQVQSAIASTRERERADVKRAMAELAEKRGFTLNELMGGRGKGKISVAKFANPADVSQTWTGRGRKPNWLVAKLKRGAAMSDFAI
jgi:DNA-binding protein H-NS